MINISEPDFNDRPGIREIPSYLYKKSSVKYDHIDVSILTPYFNTEDFFAETFISVQAQSLQNWEWIIVDDGSTDEISVERLKNITDKDDRIKIIRQKNAGPSAARNTAFKNSSGRYVFLLDSDDMVEPTYLEKCVWFLDSNPEFSFCNSYSVVFDEKEYLWTNGFERGKAHLQANSGPPISVIRRSAYDDSGGFDESILFGHEDWDFWLSMAKAGHWGYTIKEYLQWYRKRNTGRFEKIMADKNINKEFEKHISQKYKGLEKSFPTPVRRHPQPFENIESRVKIANLFESGSKERIMFILPWMVTGGADRVNLDLIEGIISRGYNVTICATLSTFHNWEHQFSALTPDIFILPNFLHQKDYPSFLAYIISSRKINSVLISGSTLGYQLLPYLRAVSPGVSFIDLCHVEEPHWLNGGHPRFGVGYQDQLDLNIVSTQHLANWMQEQGADRGRIRTMYTGIKNDQSSIDPNDLAFIRKEYSLQSDIPTIVFAGRLCEQKRPNLLAKILKSLHEDKIQFQALIVGDGELRSELELLLEKYNLTRQVQMTGSVSHRKWLDILTISDILLMPSQYEGISIALLEAMAAGVVPVVADVGGQDEIVTPSAGILVPQSQDEILQYKDKLTHLITDRSRLKKMAEECKRLISSKLSHNRTIDTFLEIVNEAHKLSLESPRISVSPKFGQELAKLSLEYLRLGEAVTWLGQASKNGSITDPDTYYSPETMVVAKIAIKLSQTRLGRYIIHNRYIISSGRYIKNIMNRLSTKTRTV